MTDHSPTSWNETRNAGFHHFIQPLSGLNPIDFVERVFGKGRDVETLSRTGLLMERVGPSPHHRAEDWGRLKFHTPATLAFAAMNSRRSALICSAFVVGMPCGKPLYVFKIAPFTNFALSGPESA